MIPLGTPIAVVAPAGICNMERLQAGLAIARERGHLLLVPDQLQPGHRYLAGDDTHRLSQLLWALTAPEIGAVWAARGGYGVTRLLPQLRAQGLPARPLIGFSDLTPLLHWLHTEVGSPTIHGPVLHSLASTDDGDVDDLFRLLAGESRPPLQGESWVAGTAHGPLIGGNLAMLASVCGTPFQPDTQGAILVLEDVGESPYRIDRMLQQIASAGLLHPVAGVALGQFTHCAPPADARWTLRDVLLEHLGGLGVPVLAELPIGHGPRNRAFQIGSHARIRTAGLHLER